MIGQLLNPHGFFYPEGSLGVFLLLTIFLGGGRGGLAGRAIAVTWRPWWNVILYMMVLGAVVRFFHYSLFGGALLSIHYYVVDTMICLARRLHRLSRHAGVADGHTISLDISVERAVALAPQAALT